MDVIGVLALASGILLLGYLIVALVKADRF